MTKQISCKIVWQLFLLHETFLNPTVAVAVIYSLMQYTVQFFLYMPITIYLCHTAAHSLNYFKLFIKYTFMFQPEALSAPVWLSPCKLRDQISLWYIWWGMCHLSVWQSLSLDALLQFWMRLRKATYYFLQSTINAFVYMWACVYTTANKIKVIQTDFSLQTQNRGLLCSPTPLPLSFFSCQCQRSGSLNGPDGCRTQSPLSPHSSLLLSFPHTTVLFKPPY